MPIKYNDKNISGRSNKKERDKNKKGKSIYNNKTVRIKNAIKNKKSIIK